VEKLVIENNIFLAFNIFPLGLISGETRWIAGRVMGIEGCQTSQGHALLYESSYE
jgi:hypothetical protein